MPGSDSHSVLHPWLPPETEACGGQLQGPGGPQAALPIAGLFMTKTKVRLCTCCDLDYCSEIFSLFPYFQGGRY